MLLKIRASLFALCLAAPMFGQQELMLHQTPANLWHKNTLNPAYFPKDKHLVIGLPGYSLDQWHSGTLALGDLFKDEAGKTFIDLDQVISKLEPNNQLDLDQRIETVSVGFKVGGVALSIGHAVRLGGTFDYPKNLAELIWYGNGPYIGKTLNIAPSFDYKAWNEIGAGASIALGPIRVGGRIKYLSGAAALQTDPNHRLATVYTNPDIYQLQLATDYQFRASSLITSIDTAGYGFSFQTESQNTWKVFSKNSGIAFDLGATASLLDERLTVSASLLDIGGKINWSENANTFHSQGAWEYAGATIPGIDILNGTDSLSFDSKLDTLNDIFKFGKTATSFSTTLPRKMYLGANLKLTDWLTVGAVYFQQHNEARDVNAYGVNAQVSPFKWLTTGVMFSKNNRSNANLGFNLSWKLWKLQGYFVSDNLLNVFRPNSVAALNFRVGGDLMF